MTLHTGQASIAGIVTSICDVFGGCRPPEAKECRSTWGLSGFEMPSCLRNSAQAMRTPLATMGWSGHRPGKSQSLGLRQRQ